MPKLNRNLNDKFNLERFLMAQEGQYETAIKELASGLKRTHWMWFVFPQIDGLALSEIAHRYSIRSIEEAHEYLEHPVLGSRLMECSDLLLGHEGKSANGVFSYPDDLKLRSSMTLFSFVADEDSVFQSVLDKYFAGKPDELTIDILNRLAVARPSVNTNPRIPESSTFNVFANRVAKIGKDMCGDSFVVGYFEDDEILLLAVADGVSSCPCDWKASETACEALVERFKSAPGSIAQRMANAAFKAHSAVSQIGGRCAGSITSLTLVVWAVASDEIHVLNVGDSRAYVGPDNALEQITSDDVQPVILKRNGEVVLQAGVPLFMRGVTRSLGQIESLEFSVRTHPFRCNDLLLLVSDGISKNEAFTSQLPGIFCSANIEQGLSKLVAESSPKNKDDATLIAVWRAESDEKNLLKIQDCFAEFQDFRTIDLAPNQVSGFLKSELIARIVVDNNPEVNKILDYSERFGIKFDMDFLSTFLSHVIRQGTDRQMVARIREMIRRSS